MTTRTLKSKLDRLAALQAEIEALATEADTIKAAIKQEMEKRGTDELQAGGHVARWKMVTSTRLDQKAMREAHSRLYEDFLVPATARRFVLATA